MGSLVTRQKRVRNSLRIKNVRVVHDQRIFFLYPSVSFCLQTVLFFTCFSHYDQVRTSDKIIEAAKTGNLNMVRFFFFEVVQSSNQASYAGRITRLDEYLNTVEIGESLCVGRRGLDSKNIQNLTKIGGGFFKYKSFTYHYSFTYNGRFSVRKRTTINRVSVWLSITELV